MRFYTVAKGFLSLLLRIKGLQIRGLENVPAGGPLIVASNHISVWDPIIVGCALPRDISFMAKEELFRYPILGKVIEALGVFAVKRGHGDIGAIRKAIAVLKEGRALGIFPEGTRAKAGEQQEALAGVVLIMEKSKAPILPVKVYGTKGLLRQKRGNIGIIIGKPIHGQDLVTPQEVVDRRSWLAKEIMSIVNGMDEEIGLEQDIFKR